MIIIPIYLYQCENGHITEKLQKFNETLEECPECGEKVEKLIAHNVGIKYNCKGFIQQIINNSR